MIFASGALPRGLPCCWSFVLYPHSLVLSPLASAEDFVVSSFLQYAPALL